MADWSSDQYLKFKNQRTQPTIDLVARIKGQNPSTIADIGCGPGNSTAVLKRYFPNADIVGIDNSPDMINKAQKEHPDIKFLLCDALDLQAGYDILFSNACLQWIPDHKTLIPTLMRKLNKNGVLAVQMPMNEQEPLYKIIDDVAAQPKWGFAGVELPPNKTLTPLEYFDILSACSSAFDMWEIKYYHPLADHKALVEWVKGSRLRPYLDFLGRDAGEEFENEIISMAQKVYPIRSDGSVVFGFRRFFFTAKR